MGLIVRIGGDEPVEWQQPTVANGEWVSLNSGPNLVAWTGPSGTPIDLAVRSIGDSFTHAFYSAADSEDLQRYQPGAVSSRAPRHQLNRGDGLWIFNSEETRWLQPSGDRPLHPLGPPPDHVRWYASFDKYLDADGIAVIATDNVADEALFRAAAIFDEMLVNRPDIRDTLVRRRVHIAIVGQSERTFDLTPYRQYRNRIELEHFGPGGPRGIGPNNLTPTLIPEENLLCLEDDPYYGHDVAVHEFAHAIDYAISSSFQSGRFRSVLTSAYRDAREAGFWEGTHAMRNTAEFWATGVQAWLGLVGDTLYPRVTNHLDLMHYAPSLANLVSDTLGDIQVHTTCQRAQTRNQGSTRSHLIGGSLLDGSGTPIADAKVSVWPESAALPERATYSLADGTFGLLAEPGNYWLEFYFDGCRLYYRDSTPTPFKPFAANLPITEQDIALDIRLPEDLCKYRAVGRILNARGEPLPRVSVTAEGQSARITSQTALDGSFLFRFIDTGPHSLRFDYRGCQFVFDGENLSRGPSQESIFDAEQIASSELDFRLPRGACEGRIRGTILNPNGEPAVDASVGVHQPWQSEPTQVGPDGAFEVPADLPGNHILIINTPACLAYVGTNGLSTDPGNVNPLKLTNQNLEGLEVRIPDNLCDP